MKLTHYQKVRLASQMLTEQERREGISIFSSKNWINRGEAIERRIANLRIAAQMRREERKKAHERQAV